MIDTKGRRRKVSAIISDYDGTLAPTATAIRINGGKNTIPESLERLLQEISRQIPVCILSSKDYRFLQDKVPFANIISCIMGIETIVVERDSFSFHPTRILSRHLLVDDEHLNAKNSNRALSQLVEEVSSRFPKIKVERKFTLDGLLAGITFDWRSQNNDWSKYSTLVPAYVRNVLMRAPYRLVSSTLKLQTYNSHPFIDVYAADCDKGMGFDCIVEELSYHATKGSILYLGDSENDNPAFKKAGISVGVISDSRLKSDNLKSNYLIDYAQLEDFLELLMDNDFVFSERVERTMKTVLQQLD